MKGGVVMAQPTLEWLATSSDALTRSADIFKLLSDRSRLQLLSLLKQGELCVCELVDLTGMSQPNVSQHMRKLRTGGLVGETRRGQWVYYYLKSDIPEYISLFLQSLPDTKQAIERMRCKDDTCCDTSS
jgi:ArsR family transcriptional regulator